MNLIGSSGRWTLGRGDALKLLAQLPGGIIDAVITDAPYSSGGLHKSDRMQRPSEKYQHDGYAQGKFPEFHGDHRDQRSFLAWCSLWLADAWRVTVDGGVLVTFADWRMLPTMTDAVQAGGWIWRGIVPWYKPGARPQLGRFGAECEYAVWGSKGEMPTDRLAAAPDGQRALPGFIECRSVPSKEREHMTEKPLEVMRQLVRLAKPDGLILDPFLGSGTTGEAALLEGRRFVGWELSEEYLQIAAARLRDRESDAPRGSHRAQQGALFAERSEDDFG